MNNATLKITASNCVLCNPNGEYETELAPAFGIRIQLSIEYIDQGSSFTFDEMLQSVRARQTASDGGLCRPNEAFETKLTSLEKY